MKIKEIKRESKKLDATFSDFNYFNDQLFPHKITYNITADKPVLVDLYYNKLNMDESQKFPFKITSKYSRIQ